MHELYKVHRPTSFKGLAGNDAAKAVLRGWAARRAFPHAMLFTGPSGCGKTTAGRIAAKRLGCDPHDFKEINCGLVKRPIEMIRDLSESLGAYGLGGEVRVILLDEVQSLSRAGFSQQALLKMLEDTQEHVYFILCTTDPQKLIPTVRNRCYEVKFSSLTEDEMSGLLTSVAEKAKVDLTDKVRNQIVEVAEGSARRALVILDQIKNIEGEKGRLNAILKSDAKQLGINLALCLMGYRGRPKWADVSKILRELGNEEPETVRRIVMSVASNSAIKEGGKWVKNAYLVMNAFRDNFYDNGRPGLVLACFEAVAAHS